MTLKRQGDILFELVDRPVVTGMPVEDGVIAKGETTGHAHRLQGGELVRERGTGLVFVNVPEGGEVVHEEHDRIELEPGVWLVHRQVEYIGKGETQQVYD